MMKPEFVQTILRESETQTTPFKADVGAENSRNDEGNHEALFPLRFENGVVTLDDVMSVLMRRQLDKLEGLMPQGVDAVSAQIRQEMIDWRISSTVDFLKSRISKEKNEDLKRFISGFRGRMAEMESRGVIQINNATNRAGATIAAREQKLAGMKSRVESQNARAEEGYEKLAEKLGRIRHYDGFPPAVLHKDKEISRVDGLVVEKIRKILHNRLEGKRKESGRDSTTQRDRARLESINFCIQSLST